MSATPTAAAPPPVLVRLARQSDHAFITSAWSQSFERSPAAAGAERNHYRLEMAVLIGRLLKTATTLIAHDAADEDGIIGFACFSPLGKGARVAVADHLGGAELHYVYVRGGPTPEASLRRMGIARLLLEGLPIRAYTCRTPAFDARIKPHGRGWAFTPRWTV